MMSSSWRRVAVTQTSAHLPLSIWLATLMYLRPASARVERLGHVVRLAHAGELDQHRQIYAGDHLDAAGLHHRDGQIGRCAAEHVGQDDHAIAGIGARDGVDNILAALLHVVVGADRNRFEAQLGPTTCSTALRNSSANRPCVTSTSPIILCWLPSSPVHAQSILCLSGEKFREAGAPSCPADRL